ncbi:DNA-3-methyladenine glycosylase [Micromonospora sp. BL4]|uniref:DNA-3-methyladenine glycosylase family protein n=1 Tax=Micromonospora sp. BL4 TaxID=2478710 RepID=UPI0018F54A8E|nr:DNA-3-methyladenine glycosylase 2 family protein [Micromonospora sp. BL4]
MDLRATVRPLFSGDGDPTFLSTPDGFWRAVRTPDGPATLHVQMGAGADRGAFRIRAWGDGAEWARTSVPDLLGARDDWSGLDLSGHARLAEVRRRCSGLHLTRTGLVFSALVAAIFEQKTTGRQAHHSWRHLVVRYGSAAPGPAPHSLRVPPSAQEWSLIPAWAWHRAGVQPSQSRTVIAASRVAASVDRLAGLDAGDERVGAGLRSIPGVGVWTAAETTQRSHGDPDSVSVGDYNLAKEVGWALTGSPVDDDGMLELLEPWRGHRQRIVRLIGASGFRKPRFGPRITIQDHRVH